MVEKLKLGGLVLALCPCNGDFIEFECPKVRLISHALKSPLVGLLGVGLVSLLGLNIL